MQQLILKKNIDKTKMEALLNLLKSWNIEAELKPKTIIKKKKSEFSLSVGLWKDYAIDADELRQNAWKRNK